jgi:hypothetical protein
VIAPYSPEKIEAEGPKREMIRKLKRDRRGKEKKRKGARKWEKKRAANLFLFPSC